MGFPVEAEATVIQAVTAEARKISSLTVVVSRCTSSPSLVRATSQKALPDPSRSSVLLNVLAPIGVATVRVLVTTGHRVRA